MKLHHHSHTALAPSLMVGVVEGRPGREESPLPPISLLRHTLQGSWDVLAARRG